MSIARRRILGLFLPPLLFCLLDWTLTLLGQPPDYWAGKYSDVREVSPTFHSLLTCHPLAFLLGVLVWIGVIFCLTALLPDTLALSASMAATFGHAGGASSWLAQNAAYGYQLQNATFVAAALVLSAGVSWAFDLRNRVPSSAPGLTLRPGTRWLILVVASVIGIYLFVIPHGG